MSYLTECYKGLMHFPWLRKGAWATMQNNALPPNWRANWNSSKHFDTYEEAILEMNHWNTIVEMAEIRRKGFDNE